MARVIWAAGVGMVAAGLFAGLALAQAPAPSPPQPPPSPSPPSSPADAGPAPLPAPAGPRTFAVELQRSQFVVQVFKDGAAATFAHDHTVHATEVKGEITADTASPESAAVTVTVQTPSLMNDDPQIRKQFGLDPTIPEKDKRSVESSMKGESQLDVARFPTIQFTSTGVEKAGDRLTLVGDLTLHGVTQRIRMPVTVKITDSTITADGKVRFLQSDYGIKPYSAFLGAVKNKDECVLTVHLVAVAP